MTHVLHATLGDLVAANPATARLFDTVGLDYCCHGDRTLEEACATAGLDAGAVAAELTDLDVEGDTTWTTLEPAALADHIVETHHVYLHAELPLLDALATKVVGVHGERHQELAEVQRLVRALRADLEPHLADEERVLFPAIRAAAGGRTELAAGAIADPIRAMNLEHDRAGELLAALRAATSSYLVPDDACASYRSLYERLDALELDTHVHIHKENHVLFPAAMALADRGDYWDDRYERTGAEHVSWHQARPALSLELLDELRVAPPTSVIDVGGGSSTVVDELLHRGFDDITVLDVSVAALAVARKRVGDDAGVDWLAIDLLGWRPARRWGLWHDRAVFHFLTRPAERTAYFERMGAALAPGGSFILATFAGDGPEQCSGLPVRRYDAPELVEAVRAGLGDVRIVATRREVHVTPAGAEQPFTWIAGSRASAPPDVAELGQPGG